MNHSSTGIGHPYAEDAEIAQRTQKEQPEENDRKAEYRGNQTFDPEISGDYFHSRPGTREQCTVSKRALRNF